MLLEEILNGADVSKGNGVSYKAIKRYTVSVIMTSTYGRRIPEWVSAHLKRHVTLQLRQAGLQRSASDLQHHGRLFQRSKARHIPC